MTYKRKATDLVQKAAAIARSEGKLSGFTIGNTAKIDKDGLYFTPLRRTSLMVTAGVIVYSERQAIDIARIADGQVQYILVDAEKKVSQEMSRSGEPGNVERAVRETVKKSKLWIYKGNDLAVEAVDILITQLTKNELQGIGGKKVTILGAGNLGCKLALRLVERGAHVFITRRDRRKLSVITRALNIIKPIHTTARIHGTTNNEEAAKGANILVGVSQGLPLITDKIIQQLAPRAIVIDAGKGTLYKEALRTAQTLEIAVYRLDISAPFEGLIHQLWAIEQIVDYRMGRRRVVGEAIVSGGLLGRKGEVIVDNIQDPKIIYGISNGQGDFIRRLTERHQQSIRKIQKFIEDSALESKVNDITSDAISGQRGITARESIVIANYEEEAC
ncbi:MAG TPA: NAD(P)-binding domain-containing protein [Anaerolineales bacterium]|nr:NAD(P)-binding domain-containing protein [Anaerolineales bacterium]